jgi:hypothetical protein
MGGGEQIYMVAFKENGDYFVNTLKTCGLQLEQKNFMKLGEGVVVKAGVASM